MIKNYLDENGRIPTYRVQDEYELLKLLPDSKPSKRIVKTKKGLKAIKALIDLEKNYNISWYDFVKKRSIEHPDDEALFYRGNIITYKQMIEKADELANSMAKSNLKPGDEIGVCVSNTPKLVYIMLAANKLGVKINIPGVDFDHKYLSTIIGKLSSKVMFVSDDNYYKLRDIIEEKPLETLVVTSLADSLPEKPELCEGYEPKLDSYYRYKNIAKVIKKSKPNYKTYSEYIEEGKDYNEIIEYNGDLETDFLITYTSGSTKTGFPKPVIHKNRSLITMGRFHDPELSGNPNYTKLRGLAHIHPESNTNLISCISDNLTQGWSVALEPEYDYKKAPDYVLINKPNYLNITTSFLVEIAKQYLLDKAYHSKRKARKWPFLFAVFAVGEPCSKGEERLIDKFLRVSRAGSGIEIKKGIKFPFTTLSQGGGDVEHGAVFYTLWKSLLQKLYTPKMGRQEIGLFPVPFVVSTVLKKDKDGKYVECDYNENGIIVANSFTNFSGYKDNPQKTNEQIIEDDLGRRWVSCNTYGYIDKLGGVHIKGRLPKKKTSDVYTFDIDEAVVSNGKDILSSSTVEVDNTFVTTLQFQLFSKTKPKDIICDMYERLNLAFGSEIADSIYIRILPIRESYALTDAGKRSILKLEEMGLNNTINLSKLVSTLQISQKKGKRLIKKSVY